LFGNSPSQNKTEKAGVNEIIEKLDCQALNFQLAKFSSKLRIKQKPKFALAKYYPLLYGNQALVGLSSAKK